MIACPGCDMRYEDSDETRFCGNCGADLNRAREMARTGAVAALEPADPLIGRVIDGRYRVIEKIGAGGMGAVYKVEHLAMGKLAAMKVLHPSLTQDKEVASRFRREAEAVSRLSSPNTVQVFDFGESGGSMYLVMELCKGEDLGAIVRRDGPLGFARLAPMMIQVCDALSEAHELGIVHRDLKPENLLVARARDGRDLVKVLDFGLAKLRDSEELNQVTARGSLIGTPFYMSPEQIRAEELDARSDIYSLGALMYRVLTGAHPFSAPTPVAVLTMHLTEELVLPSVRAPERHLSSRVDAIVAKAMAKRREERYASADELKEALAEAASAPSQKISTLSAELRRASDKPDASPPSVATPIGAAQPLRREDFDHYERGLKVRRWLALAIVPLGLILGVGAFVVFTRVDPDIEVRETEIEPNNTPAQANPIANGRPIKGQIAKRIAVEESDRDFYRFAVKGSAPMSLRAQVSGLPNMELVLEVFDGAGNKLADVDNGDVGDGEVAPNLRVAPGEHYIAVREVWIAGRPATENVSDWYTLTATWKELAADRETEPDDDVADAIKVDVASGTATMRGYLSTADDVDYYVLGGNGGGVLSGDVSAVEGADVRIVVLPANATGGPPGPLPQGARVFDGGGVGAGEKFDGVAWPAGAASPIVVVQRKLPGARPTGPASAESNDKRRHTASGIDVEYALSLHLKP
jgi:eukaryotic-like serine/threonine-protein kinase